MAAVRIVVVIHASNVLMNLRTIQLLLAFIRALQPMQFSQATRHHEADAGGEERYRFEAEQIVLSSKPRQPGYQAQADTQDRRDISKPLNNSLHFPHPVMSSDGKSV